jgi:NADPH:quinone reductase-like Zn-dependent oxidoreductase
MKYAEKIAVSEKMLIHKPEGISFETAAGIPEVRTRLFPSPFLHVLTVDYAQTHFTAIQALYLVGGFEKGQSVLIHAGASGVGQAAIQIARTGGASKIFATAGTDAKCDLCKSLGASFAINYRSGEDFAEVIKREMDGKGVDVIIDLVGQSYWHRNMDSAAVDGRLVIVSMMSGSTVEKFDLWILLRKRLSILSTTLRSRSPEYQQQLRDTFVERVMPHLVNGEMKVTVDEVFSWMKVAEAHKKMEANQNAGKLICTVD